MQYVVARWGFRTLDLYVDRRVLIPRPETEVVAGAVIDLDPQDVVIDLGTGSGAIDSQRRFVTFVLTGFAACALLLATIGLYGMVAYSVVQRRRELGVRIALGASARNVVGLVMRNAIGFVLAGAVVGVLGALAATRILRTMLFHTTATDLTTFVAVPLVLAIAAMSASYWSGRRAADIDPMIAIKGE